MTDLWVLHDMTLFVEVARTASFSRASANLGVPGATLSRRIAAMERKVAVRLFDRTTRKVELTEAGRRYFERCGPLVDEARLAQEALRESADRPVGHLRVSMPVDTGVHHIGPVLPEFARQYLGITFGLDLSPRHSDLVGDQLVVRRIGVISLHLFAAPSYLDRYGRPQQPSELVEHDCIALAQAPQGASWRLLRDGESTEVKVRGRFGINNPGLACVLAERGMGIAVLSQAIAREAVMAGRLVAVLPEWALPALPVHAVMSSRLQPAAVCAFVNFLASRLAFG